MSRKRQAVRSTDPADYQRVPRAVAAMPKDFAAGFAILPHSHERAQLIYATAGTMRVATDDGMWIVPPQRALWMPAGVRHSIVMLGEVTMRTLYVRDDAAAFIPDTCHVLPISALLRELIVRATELPLHYDERGPAGHVVALILTELRGLQSLPLQLPMPRDARLRALCQALLDAPGDQRPLAAWATKCECQRAHLGAPIPKRNRSQFRRLATAGSGAGSDGTTGRRRACHAGCAGSRI